MADNVPHALDIHCTQQAVSGVAQAFITTGALRTAWLALRVPCYCGDSPNSKFSEHRRYGRNVDQWRGLVHVAFMCMWQDSRRMWAVVQRVRCRRPPLGCLSLQWGKYQPFSTAVRIGTRGEPRVCERCFLCVRCLALARVFLLPWFAIPRLAPCGFGM